MSRSFLARLSKQRSTIKVRAHLSELNGTELAKSTNFWKMNFYCHA